MRRAYGPGQILFLRRRLDQRICAHDDSAMSPVEQRSDLLRGWMKAQLLPGGVRAYGIDRHQRSTRDSQVLPRTQVLVVLGTDSRSHHVE